MTDKQIESLTAQYGTPLYVFDIHPLLQRIAALRHSLPASVRLCYAVKANPFLLQEIRGYVERFEVCSPGEASICRRAHIPAAQQVISGVYKTPAVMEQMLAQKNGPRLFTIESMRQFHLLSELAARYEKQIHVLLRLTSGNQFGLEEQEIVQLVRRRAEYPFVCIRGLQFFSGTQKASLKRLRRELEAVDALALSLQSELGFTVHELEFGPGFPVCYFSGQSFDEPAFLSGFSDLLAGLKCGAKVTLELGRSIAASCGTYLTRVVDVKRNKNQNRHCGRRHAPDGLLRPEHGHAAAGLPPVPGARGRARALEPVRLALHGQRYSGQAVPGCRAQMRRYPRLCGYRRLLHDRGHLPVPQPRAAARGTPPAGRPDAARARSAGHRPPQHPELRKDEILWKS